MVATDMGTRGPAAGGGVRSWRGHGDGEGEGRDANKRGQLRRRNSVDSTRVRALPHSSAVFDAGVLRGNPKKTVSRVVHRGPRNESGSVLLLSLSPAANRKLFFFFFSEVHLVEGSVFTTEKAKL